MKYDHFEIGRAYALGNEAQIEISKPCDPCIVLYQLPYVGTGKGPDFLKAMQGRRGWFARVVKPGQVQLGDVITLLE
jgi:MOSC domain-containing protein YiiM